MRKLLLIGILMIPGSAQAANRDGLGGKQIAELERREKSAEWNWSPRIRKCIPAIPGHTREIYTVGVDFEDTLRAMEKLGWPTIDWKAEQNQ